MQCEGSVSGTAARTVGSLDQAGIGDPDAVDFIERLYATRMRKGEALSPTWESFDRETPDHRPKLALQSENAPGASFRVARVKSAASSDGGSTHPESSTATAGRWARFPSFGSLPDASVIRLA